MNMRQRILRSTRQSSIPGDGLNQQRGFSLIEALVAFLILSVGMLGISSLQVLSLKAGHTAALRTVAVIKVEEMMERIRNNPTQVFGYRTAAAAIQDNNCDDHDGPVTSCAADVLVGHDIYWWQEGLKESMPADTTGTINVVDVDPAGLPLAVVTITVSWKERSPEAQALVDMSYTASSQICNSTAC